MRAVKHTHELKHLPPADLVAVVETDGDSDQLADDELLPRLLVLVPLVSLESDDELGPGRLQVEREGRDDGFEIGQERRVDGAQVVQVDADEEGSRRGERLVEVICGIAR